MHVLRFQPRPAVLETLRVRPAGGMRTSPSGGWDVHLRLKSSASLHLKVIRLTYSEEEILCPHMQLIQT